MGSLLCGAEKSSETTSTDWSPNGAHTAIDGTTYRVVSGGGTHSLKLQPNGDGFSQLDKTTSGSPTVSYGRVYFYCDALPASTATIAVVGISAGAHFYITLSTGGVLKLSNWGVVTGPTISTGHWYGIEYEVNCAANPSTARWRVTGADNNTWADQTSDSKAQAAAHWTDTALAFWGPTSGTTGFFFDDSYLGWGTTAAEFWNTGAGRSSHITLSGGVETEVTDGSTKHDPMGMSGFSNT